MNIFFWKKRYGLLLVTAVLAVTFAIPVYLNLRNENAFTIASEGYYLPLAYMNITAAEDDLFGYEDGILVSGRLFDEYKEEQISSGKLTEEEAEALEPTELMEANFNHKEWVRKCNVLLKDEAGGIILNDRAGVRISGNASRKLCQKSLCIIADGEYGSKNDAFYLQLGDRKFDGYKKLRVHSGGQDLRKTQLKDEIMASFMNKCGMTPKREILPLLIFVNKDFYGVGHLENRMDEDFIAGSYGLSGKDIELCEGGIEDILDILGYDARKDYDFSDDELREAFEEKADVNNLMTYLAFNIAAGNTDWPQNNIVMWRYRGQSVDGIAESDGRFRFVPSDVDVVFMDDEKPDPFDQLTWGETDNYFRFIDALTSYPEYRDLFVNNIMDIMSLCFNEEYVYSEIQRIQKGYGDAFRYGADHAFSEQQREYLIHHDEQTAVLTQRIIARSQKLCDILYRKYDTGDGYTLVLKAPLKGELREGLIRLRPQEADLESLRSNSAVINVSLTGADDFAGFMVNGDKRAAENGYIRLSGSDARDGRIVVEAYYN